MLNAAHLPRIHRDDTHMRSQCLTTGGIESLESRHQVTHHLNRYMIGEGEGEERGEGYIKRDISERVILRGLYCKGYTATK